MSYTKKALRSGVIQQIFAAEFAKSAIDPEFTKSTLLDLHSGDVNKALRKFAGKKNAIGKATEYLRKRLDKSGGNLVQN